MKGAERSASVSASVSSSVSGAAVDSTVGTAVVGSTGAELSPPQAEAHSAARAACPGLSIMSARQVFTLSGSGPIADTECAPPGLSRHTQRSPLFIAAARCRTAATVWSERMPCTKTAGMHSLSLQRVPSSRRACLAWLAGDSANRLAYWSHAMPSAAATATQPLRANAAVISHELSRRRGRSPDADPGAGHRRRSGRRE